MIASIQHPSRPNYLYQTRFCARCQCDRQFGKRRIAHRFHGILTLLTFGLWGISWAAVTFADRRRPWRCSICGSRYVPNAEPDANPDPRKTIPSAPPKPRSSKRRCSWE